MNMRVQTLIDYVLRQINMHSVNFILYIYHYARIINQI